MAEFFASVIGALAAGALARAGDVGGRAVADAYDALRALIVRKLGKGGRFRIRVKSGHKGAQAIWRVHVS
jgi:hypothetical protein